MDVHEPGGLDRGSHRVESVDSAPGFLGAGAGDVSPLTDAHDVLADGTVVGMDVNPYLELFNPSARLEIPAPVRKIASWTGFGDTHS